MSEVVIHRYYIFRADRLVRKNESRAISTARSRKQNNENIDSEESRGDQEIQ